MKGNQWHFGMKAHIGVDAKRVADRSLVPPRPTSMTSMAGVICLWKAICLQRAAQGRQREGWP